MGLGARIAELRLKKGFSLQEVADAVGVSKAHIWDLERKSGQPFNGFGAKTSPSIRRVDGIPHRGRYQCPGR